MKNTVLVDISWGDCGKGKIADVLMEDHDVCVKYNGGPNAGATYWIDGKRYALHLIPAGILRNKPCYIAPTCLVNPYKLLQEIAELTLQGFDVKNNLKISPHCHVITQEHINEDTRREDAGKGVGSTKQGISPCCQDKYGRKGIRLYEWGWNDESPFVDYFADVSADLNWYIKNGKSILFQSSQGTMLDVDHGFYPYVSTTNNVAAAAPMACGIGPQYITNVVGVFKAYSTYVGSGPFPVKIMDQKVNDLITELGSEYGTTTGRRRQVGWVDLPSLEYAIRINGVTELAVTKADVLEGINPIYYNESYEKNEFFYKDFEYAKPNLVPYHGSWIGFIDDVLAKKLSVPIKYVSCGKDRKDIGIRQDV